MFDPYLIDLKNRETIARASDALIDPPDDHYFDRLEWEIAKEEEHERRRKGE